MNTHARARSAASFALCTTLLAAVAGAPSALAQCSVLVEDTFRLGMRPHGGNGSPRDAQIHDGLGGYWAQTPAGAQWNTANQGWIFAAASLDPIEVDPLDPFNGVAFLAGTHNAALLPFVPPAHACTLSMEVALGQGMASPIYAGFTPSAALTDNFAASGALWVSVDPSANWQVLANGSSVIASGTGDYAQSLNSGWLHVELTLDVAAGTASGSIGGAAFGPVPVTLGVLPSRIGFEAHDNFFNAVNNFRVIDGAPLTVTPTLTRIEGAMGGSVTLSATTNAAAPSGFAWLHDGALVVDGVTGSGSTIAGATTPSLSITGVGAADLGSYTPIAFNGCGERAGAPIALVGACYANCDGSAGTPALTAADFACFLQKFRAGDAYANCDGSSGTPTLTAGDFACFLQKFRAGCV